MNTNFFKTLITCAGLLAPVPALASPVLTDNFDSENGGFSAIPYSGFANFGIFGPPGGSVDLVSSGDFGINCVGGAGTCVDLDGSTSLSGGLLTLVPYAFNAGDLVTLSFDYSGNQRGGPSDGIFFGFQSLSPVDFLNVTASSPVFGAFVLGDMLGSPFAALGFDQIASGDPFDRMSFSFRAGTSGSIFAFVADASLSPTNPNSDNQGAIVDNFLLSVDPVPEPATWLTMLFGMGLVGAALRRRTGTSPRLRFAVP